MKLFDVGLFLKRRRIELCRKNKKGLPQSGGIDVTTDVIDMFITVLETEESKHYQYTKDGLTYKIQIQRMTAEEVEESKVINDKDKKRRQMETAQLLSVFDRHLSIPLFNRGRF